MHREQNPFKDIATLEQQSGLIGTTVTSTFCTNMFCCGLSLLAMHILCPCRPRAQSAEHNSNPVTHFGGSHWCISAGTCNIQ